MTDATRLTLIGRLADWNDRVRWQQFFETYWRLIYAVARRAGLNDAEAQDVVQETVLAVAKNITRYDRAAGRFKPWLLQMTRWRIADQFRKRLPEAERSPGGDQAGARDTATMDRIPSPEPDLETAWDEEWQQQLLQTALEHMKTKVNPAHFQIFDCAVRKQWPADKVARELGVNIAQVYLVRHRLGAMLRKVLLRAERGG